MDFRIDIDSAAVADGLKKAPAAVARHVGLALDRAAEEVAREARRLAPKAFSTLTNSIHAHQDGAWRRIVAPSVNYAMYVETGTGPAVGQDSYMPNPVHLRGWIKQHGGISFGTTKRGSRARQEQYDEIRDRSFALAMYIKQHGTKPHPYMRPAAEGKADRVRVLLEDAVARGLEEALG